MAIAETKGETLQLDGYFELVSGVAKFVSEGRIPVLFPLPKAHDNDPDDTQEFLAVVPNNRLEKDTHMQIDPHDNNRFEVLETKTGRWVGATTTYHLLPNQAINIRKTIADLQRNK